MKENEGKVKLYTVLFFSSGGQAVICEVNFIFILDYKSRNKHN